MAVARRSSAFAWAICLSASACWICRWAPIFLPISTSAISIDRISNAVPLSRPFARTVLEIRSGFSSTALWLLEEPTVVTIPSPTRAMMVSSPAPPTSLARFALTVTFAITFTSIPSIATAAIQGVSMIFGVTLILTASKTLRPARSIAAALSKDRSRFAL